MTTTELGEYLASHQRDKEAIHGDFLIGSLVTDYLAINEKTAVSLAVGVKQRWIGSAMYVMAVSGAGSEHGWISPTGAGNYLTPEGESMSAWAFHASGSDSQ